MNKLGVRSTEFGVFYFLGVIFCLLLTPNSQLITPNCYAEPISSTELIEKAKAYNNTVVEYQGEVVGDVMVRGDFAWVNLNDGINAIGVWGSKDIVTNLVNCKGSYNCKGDVLRIKGIFHRACPQHGGDLDIHLNEATRVKEGFRVPHNIKSQEVKWTIGLGIAALGLAILCDFRSKRKD